jgi:hypothetical protein
MFFQSDGNSVDSVYCDFSSAFLPNPLKIFFRVYDLKWPDDFEDGKDIGTSRFQVISDFKSGLCLFNHEGNLYPFTESILLERRNKIKMNVITDNLGTMLPFSADNVYSLETGFNSGDVEFMTFDALKRKGTSFDGFESNRKVLYRFPLFWLLQKVVELKEMQYKKNLKGEDIEKLEKDKIINHDYLKEWKFKERDISPSMDKYREIIESTLQNYHFTSKDDYVYIRIKFELFQA